MVWSQVRGVADVYGGRGPLARREVQAVRRICERVRVLRVSGVALLCLTGSRGVRACNRFGRGEGVVVIVLKPLAAALRDHDHVYATVRAP